MVLRFPCTKKASLMYAGVGESCTLRRKRLVVVGKFCIELVMYFSRMSSALIRCSDACCRSSRGTYTQLSPSLSTSNIYNNRIYYYYHYMKTYVHVVISYYYYYKVILYRTPSRLPTQESSQPSLGQAEQF